jgi:hypothetical protein
LVAVPYDITQISWIADELESSWHRMMLLVDQFTDGRSERLRNSVRRRLLEQARVEISGLGAPARSFQNSIRARASGGNDHRELPIQGGFTGRSRTLLHAKGHNRFEKAAWVAR